MSVVNLPESVYLALTEFKNQIIKEKKLREISGRTSYGEVITILLKKYKNNFEVSEK